MQTYLPSLLLVEINALIRSCSLLLLCTCTRCALCPYIHCFVPQLDKKCNPHLTIVAIAPNQSARKIAWGLCEKKNVRATTFAIKMVLRHLEVVFKLWSVKQWHL